MASCIPSSSKTTLPVLSRGAVSALHARTYVTKAEKAAAVKASAKKPSPGYVDPRSAPPPSDAKLDAIRSALYPPNSFAPKSVTPTGSHRPRVMERIETIVHDPIVHETIERAWNLYRRHEAERQQSSLKAKFKAMEEACDELEEITAKGLYPRTIYDAAVRKPDPFAKPRLQGRRISPEEKWKEGRLDGLVPREAWVPVDIRGKGWDYDWKRPAGDEQKKKS